jgi:starch synthase
MRIVPAAEEQLFCDRCSRSAGYVLNGILNGIDMSVWNPEEDSFIEHNYSLGNYSSGKAANKLALQKELGLPERDVSE